MAVQWRLALRTSAKVWAVQVSRQSLFCMTLSGCDLYSDAAAMGCSNDLGLCRH